MPLNHGVSLRFTLCNSRAQISRRRSPIALVRRHYADKPANPYTSTIALPKTDYQLWPKHHLIQNQFIKTVTDDCYKWQV